MQWHKHTITALRLLHIVFSVLILLWVSSFKEVLPICRKYIWPVNKYDFHEKRKYQEKCQYVESVNDTLLALYLLAIHFGAYDLAYLVSLVISRKYRGWWEGIHQRQSIKAEEP